MPPAEPYRIQESPHHSQLREGTTSFACRDDTCQLTTEDASQLHNILVDEECASSTSIGSVLSYAHEERLLQFYIVMPMTVAAQQLPFSELCEEIISTFLE